MTADLQRAGGVFGAVEHEDFTVADHGGGVEGGVGFPLNEAVVEGGADGGDGAWRDDRVDGGRLFEGAEHPGAGLGGESLRCAQKKAQ